jgi:hypothetical protein
MALKRFADKILRFSHILSAKRSSANQELRIQL